MFWRFGGYANISTIDTLLEKPDFTLEDLLDEADLLHEIKQHNAKLVEYLREEPVLERLLDYVVAPCLEPVASPDKDHPTAAAAAAAAADDDKGKGPAYPFSRSRASSLATSEPDEDEGEKRRNRHAYVASEVLASDTWSIYEALMENGTLVRDFWGFLSRPAPLDPLQASYFTKVNEALFEKKTEDMIEVLKSVPNAISDLLRHVECPMIMDLLLKIIALDRTEGGQGIVEWLYSQDVVPILLSCLSPDRNWVVQTAAGDFIKAIITISANASQNEQQCIGPNELTRQLVSTDCVRRLIKYMLAGGNPLTVGVGIVIEVIRKNNSDYDPDVGAEEGSMPSCRDPIYLGTLLRLFAEHVPDFMSLIMNAPTPKQDIHSTFGHKIEPLGFDRFKTCELMAELLHCSNMGLMNEVGSEELIVARDAERHRLRDDGKLVPRREDDMSMSPDDLGMRFPHHESHGAGAGDGRRLEVTNAAAAEDDGFEEIEHSREMNEDTSHEFVKAEDEIPLPVPIPSFFDRDDDDLMDEPLSSPRLHIKELELDPRPFDELDLVVAPLSPKKRDAATVGSDAAPSVPAAEEDEPRPAEEGDAGAETVETKDADEDAKDVVPARTEEVSAQGGEPDSSAVTPAMVELDLEQETKPEPETSTSPQPEPEASESGPVEEEREDSKVSGPTSSETETAAAAAAQTAESADLLSGARAEIHTPETAKPETATAETPKLDTAAVETATAETAMLETAKPEITTAETPTSETPTEKTATAETPALETATTVTPTAETPIPVAATEKTAAAETAKPETPTAETATPETPTPQMPTLEAAKPPPPAPAPPAPSQEGEAPKLPPRNDAGDSDDGDATHGTESIIIRAVPDPPTNEVGNNAPERPVVGDYLKMQFVEHRVVPAILTFFFKYPWNNFLHNVVYDIVQQVFNGPMDRGFNPTLAVSLFESADVTNAIIQGQRISDESQAKTKTRMGYMGHLTLIAEEVVKFTERHPPELLSDTVLDRVMCQDWVNYVEGALAETRERDNAILGGVRPEVAMSNRAAVSGLASPGLSGLGGPSLGMGNQGSASSALADAGLNGNLELDEGGSGSGLGPFTISAGTMMSGFGSSSDEEDDEVEDTEEDINNEFRSYTDTLSNNGSSLSPPSIPPPPPPPPPLNTPPSRARLQLAARLAMHQKTSAAAIAAPLGGDGMEHARSVDLPSGAGAGIGSNNGDDDDDDDDDDEPLRDPFGDDADEVDSDDEGGGWGAPSRSGAGRGGWWRDVVMKRDNMTDSDEEGDEEFGDFAMPEGSAVAEAGGSGSGSESPATSPGARPEGLRIVKPLALHPGGAGAGAQQQQQKSGFGSLWPFGTQIYGQSKEEGKEGEEKKEGKAAEGDGICRTVEAKTRTSLDDGDDEFVV